MSLWQVFKIPAGLDASVDMARSLLLADDEYAWANLERGWPVMQDMLKRHHRRFPLESASVASAAEELRRKHNGRCLPDEAIASQVQALLAAVAADPASLQCQHWIECLGKNSCFAWFDFPPWHFQLLRLGSWGRLPCRAMTAMRCGFLRHCR